MAKRTLSKYRLNQTKRSAKPPPTPNAQVPVDIPKAPPPVIKRSSISGQYSVRGANINRAIVPPAEPAPAPAAMPPVIQPRTRQEEDQAICRLLDALIEEEGQAAVTQEQVLVADSAERRGFVTRQRLRLYLTEAGRQFWELNNPESPDGVRRITAMKVTLKARAYLHAIARAEGTTMLDAGEAILEVVERHGDALRRLAMKFGGQHSWEAIPYLARD